MKVLLHNFNEFWNYKVYRNLSYFWNFGFLSAICLIIQIITGLFLSMSFIADSTLASISVEHIMRDMNDGWLLRYCHATGASFFFIRVYLHIFRNLYYSSYLRPRQLVWLLGMLILILMILTAFLGYVLPWGQMSFWAATVITSLFSAIPLIGDIVVIWLWGGYAVDNATLTRFYSLHFICPFILLFLVFLHILLLHIWGSTNPLGIKDETDKLSFGPYFIIKDFFSLLFFMWFYFIMVSFWPNYLGHSDNYIQANSLVTPAHIVPEWYFLPFYAVLRSIPNKLGGILMLLLVIILLVLLPFWLAKDGYRSFTIVFYHELCFWFFVITCILLGWLGGQTIDYPYIGLGQLLTLLYIIYLTWSIFAIHYLAYIKRTLYHSIYFISFMWDDGFDVPIVEEYDEEGNLIYEAFPE